VVDRRGPDPVPENDSHGEFIYLIRTYFNYTHDSLFVRAYYPQVCKAVGYIEELIAQRSTDRYCSTTDSLRIFYGLLPESISHEGYSAKPMHSYWDDFWGLRGLKDAAEIARIVGDSVEAGRIGMIRDTFRTNLIQSIQRSVVRHGIDYIPGCAELGDFDATSTTIALYPVGETAHLPQSLLRNTFERYYRFTEDRATGRIDWENYTPYEVRTIGSFILLDQPQRAHQLIDRFVKDRRPAGWNHWAEVVWKDPRLARFIGDMPHTWVGSDFINSIRMMFVYENEEDTSLIIGAGLVPAWIDDPAGISLENLPTYYGDLSYSIRKLDDRRYRITLEGIPRIPAGGLVLKNFNAGRMPHQVEVNGQSLSGFRGDRITIAVCPAEIVITY
nr:hypothetical protein [Candidatus Delongbacteria bacterium]